MNKYIFIVLCFLSCNCVFSQNLVPILKVAKKPNDSSLTENTKQTNIIPQLQESLQKYIKNHANPIAAVVVVEVASGKILALSSILVELKLGLLTLAGSRSSNKRAMI